MEKLTGILKEKFKEIQIGAVIGCHGGPRLVGFMVSDKYDFDDFEG